MAKVSICIPAYKDAAGVDRLLNSIVSSGYKDYEVILTDDTPDDSVYDVVKAYSDRLDIAYTHNTPSLGPGGNWNEAISRADGEYVKIMHQDDWFTTPSSLGEFVKMLDDDPDAVLAYSGSRQVTVEQDDPCDLSVYYDRCISDEHRELIDSDWRNIYVGQYIGAPSATIYRNCGLRFENDLHWLIDADFYMGLLSGGGRSVCTKEPLVSIGISRDQLTNSCADDKDTNIREYRFLFNKFGLSDSRVCRDKLTDICVSFKGAYSDIKDTGITPEEYRSAYKAYSRDLKKFHLYVLLKKLHINMRYDGRFLNGNAT